MASNLLVMASNRLQPTSDGLQEDSQARTRLISMDARKEMHRLEVSVLPPSGCLRLHF